MRKLTRALAVILALGVLAFALRAQTESAAPVSPTAEETLGKIQSQIDRIESNTGLDQATREAALGALNNAKAAMDRAAAFSKEAADFRQRAEEAPQLLASIRSELAQSPTAPSPQVPENATLQQVEQGLSQATADLQAARQSERELADAATRNTNRRNELPGLIARLREQISELDRTLQDPSVGDPSSPMAEAQRTQLQAQRIELEQHLRALEAEVASHSARSEMRIARQDRAKRRTSEAEQLVAAWQSIVSARRQAEAVTTAQEAQRLRRAAARQHAVLQQYAEETAERAKSRTGAQGAASRIDLVTQEAEQAESRVSRLRSEFDSIDRRIDASGLNRATGLLLRRLRESLPSENELSGRIRSTQSELENVEYELIDLQEERFDAGDIDQVAQSLIAQIPEAERNADMEAAARELAAARRDLLDQLISDTTTLFNRLLELNVALRETRRIADVYSEFVSERILWVPSHTGDRLPHANDIAATFSWLTNQSAWKEAATTTWDYVRRRAALSALLTILALALWFISNRCRRELRRRGELVSRFTTDSTRHTVAALILTMLLAAPEAVTLALLGLLLIRPEGQPQVAAAVGNGLLSAAAVLYPLVLLRHVTRVGGLALAHFRWPSLAVKGLRRSVRWFTPIMATLAGLIGVLDNGVEEPSNAFTVRILFTAQLITLGVFLYRVLGAKSPVLRETLEKHKKGWMYRLRHVWRSFALLFPAVMIVLSWVGYHYTAVQLELRFERSLMLALALVLINGLTLRWLFVARRRLAVEEARRRRAQAAAEADSASATSLSIEEEERIDLPALSEQTKHLFHTGITVGAIIGLVVIWSAALPALRMLDRVQLWPNVQLTTLDDDEANQAALSMASASTSQSGASGGATNGNGSSTNGASSSSPLPTSSIQNELTDASSTEAVGHTITVADVGVFLLVLIATYVLFKDVPGLLEIVVLQRLPMDAGSRYALSTVIRYAIAIIGIVAAFNALGMTWSSVQWLAAALTFGLAFGLQEIFANFISGLIILAERPIRIGDTVTVGNVTGTVSKIRMRATVITDWDKKELVIPNKTFITGDIINWSLTDPIIRVILPVGVSYSSDVELVEKLLMRAAKEASLVLSDPEPRVMFLQFGDSTLNFELRVYINDIDVFVAVKHQLHMTIIKLFREHDVEIAFPQRDLHIRSAPGLDEIIRMQQKIGKEEYATDPKE